MKVELFICDACDMEITNSCEATNVLINHLGDCNVCSECYDKLALYANKIRDEKWRETSNEV